MWVSTNSAANISITYLAESESRGRGTVATANTGTDTNDLGVNGAGDAVVKLDIQLGDGIDYKNVSDQKPFRQYYQEFMVMDLPS
jgi:hypothetical protein